jgi:alkylation response protein AidB-like acyl-CoA dehydrogenase
MFHFKSNIQSLLTEEQLLLQDSFSKFVEKEIVPNFDKWYFEDRQVDKALYKKMGDAGFLVTWADSKYGGAGLGWIESWIIANELARRGMGGVQTWLHSDIVAPYLKDFGSTELQDKFMPDLVKGNKVLAVAMTEPDYGSDVGSVKTSAVKDGDDYIINGNKIFISNGMIADVFVVLVRTNPDPELKHKGLSLVVVDATESEGVTRKKLDKMGGHIMDTAEVFFDNVRVPQENLLGVEGKGFTYVMMGLQQERILAATMAQSACEKAVLEAVKYAKERVVFGKPLSTYQNTEFRLAAVSSKIVAGRNMVDNLVMAHNRGENVGFEVAAAKMYTCELVKEAVDVSLQIHGGYGYMMEYPIARMYIDARVSSISAGTSEVMKMILGRDLFYEPKSK